MTYVIVIIPFCFAALSNHDVWSGLLDLVLRKAHKCTVNVKFSLNLSGMDLALPIYHPADHFCATTSPLVRTTLVLLLLKIFVHDQIDLKTMSLSSESSEI